MWRGSPCTGISMPTIAPTSRDHAPAAHTTVSVAIVPCAVRTPVMRPPARSMPIAGQPCSTRAPQATAAAA